MSIVKQISIFSVQIFFCAVCFGQTNHIDSLKKQLTSITEDTNKVNILSLLGNYYEFYLPDTAIMYLQQGLQLAQKLNYEKGQAFCMINFLSSLTTLGDYTNALNFGLKGLSLSKKLKDTGLIIYANGELSMCYRDNGDYKKGLENAYEALRLTALLHVDKNAYNSSYDYNYYNYLWGQLSSIYEKSNQLDSAIYYGKKAWELDQEWSAIAYILVY